MITYYLYGRKNGVGYVTHDPIYSREDETLYFLKMTEYKPLSSAKVNEVIEENNPEKVFLYNFESEKRGTALVWGKSMQIGADLFSDPGRSSVFSHQYILDGIDREKALSHISDLLDCTGFYHKLSEAYTKDPVQQDWFFSLPDEVELQKQDIVNYSSRQLIDLFHLRGQKLQELLYAALHFDKTIYIMLPENNSRGTSYALALMKKLMEVLPPMIVSRTGFVTYAESINDDFIRTLINICFIADTEDNRRQLQRGDKYYFIPEVSETNVDIPENMAVFAEMMESAFLTGEKSENLVWLYEILGKYLRESNWKPASEEADSSDAISDVEYDAFQKWLSLQDPDTLNGCPEEDIWKLLNLLNLMTRKRAFIWNDQLARDVLIWEKKLITEYPFSENDRNYHKFFAEYERDNQLLDVIVDYFIAKIWTQEDLVRYMKLLEDCEPVRQGVSEQISSLILELVQEGKLDESLYPTLMDYYYSGEISEDVIINFFADKCQDLKTMRDIYNFLASQKENNGADIWEKVKRMVYRNPDMEADILSYETHKLKKLVLDTEKTLEERNLYMWSKLNKLRNYNDQFLIHDQIIETVYDIFINFVFSEETLEDAKSLLRDSVQYIRNSILPDCYSKIVSKVSEEYLKENGEKFVRKGTDPRLFDDWPCLDNTNSVLKKTINLSRSREKISTLKKVFQAKTSSTVNNVILYLKELDLKDLEILNQDQDFLSKQIDKILSQINEQTSSKKNHEENEQNFDKVHAYLIVDFPDQTSKILKNYLEAPQGGFLGMKNLQVIINNFKKGEKKKDTNEKMREAVLKFAEEYEIGKQDIRALKEKSVFFISILSPLEYDILVNNKK